MGREVEAEEEEEMAASSVASLGISPESVPRAEAEEGEEGGDKYNWLHCYYIDSIPLIMLCSINIQDCSIKFIM